MNEGSTLHSSKTPFHKKSPIKGFVISNSNDYQLTFFRSGLKEVRDIIIYKNLHIIYKNLWPYIYEILEFKPKDSDGPNQNRKA